MRKRNKAVKLAISLIAIIALLTTGTFAWFTFAEQTNNFRGTGDCPGGTLHDDFAAPKKNVYVENWGDEPIFVRIKLTEYMEIGEGAGRYYGPENARVQDPANKARPNVGFIYDQSSWTAHAPHNNQVNNCNPGREEAYLMYHDYWRWTMGGWKFYKPADETARKVNGYVAQDTEDYNASDHMPRTLDAMVVSMAVWKGMGRPIGNYWVIDKDGWAYWAAPLAPETATGLLLRNVELISAPYDDYYYGINVIAQMATREGMKNGDSWNYRDFGKDENGGWTDDGRDLMEYITGGGGGFGKVNITSSDVPVVWNKIFFKPGETAVLTANTTGDPVDWTAPTGTGITFSVVADNAAMVTISDTAAVGTRYTVSAADRDDPTETDTKYIYVIPPDVIGVVPGLNGKVYLDYGDNTFRELREDGTIGPWVCPPSGKVGVKGKPGGWNDRADVVIGVSDNGAITRKYLGPNDDDSYYKAGPDGLLGTPDDIKVWKIDDSKPIGPDNETEERPGGPTAIKLVRVSPASAAVVQGQTQAFSAQVVQNNDALASNQNVTWSVEGGGTGTSISSGGVLTVDADEPATTLVVFATSVADNKVSGYAVVTVESKLAVDRVEITPATATVLKGSTSYVNFTAKVFMDDGSLNGDGVDWAVSGGNDSSISQTGRLTVGAGENAATLTVTATSKKDGTVSATATVNVKGITDVPEPVVGRTLTPDKTGDTVDWLEIATNGKYSLIVRKSYLNIGAAASNYGKPAYQITIFGASVNYKTSVVRNFINAWFTGTAATAADNLPATARLRSYTMQNNAVDNCGTATFNGAQNTGFSKPSVYQVGTGNDVAFVLSYGESANFISRTYHMRGVPIANVPSSDIAVANFGRLSIPDLSPYYWAWLRSVGDSNPSVGVLELNASITIGRAFQNPPSETKGFVYPALWVDQAIFD